MNIQQLYNCTAPRALAWCVSDELTDNNDGTYTVKDATTASKLGTGSEIIVIDSPGKLLFYDAESSKAYDWTAEA